ncbi:MAG: hypothetical protein ACI91U_002099, partial [Candidatus Poriferisodalaceae bacterium]
WTRSRKAPVSKAPFISYKEGVTGSSPVAPTLQYEPEAPSPVSLSPKGLSKLGCGLEGQTADKVLADRC